MKRSAQDPGSNAAKRPTEIPAWLNEACANVLNCASATIHHLCGAASVNELVKVYICPAIVLQDPYNLIGTSISRILHREFFLCALL